MKVSSRIKSILLHEDITLTELAARLDISINNLSNKLKRDNFKLEELEEILDVIGYDLEINFKQREPEGTPILDPQDNDDMGLRPIMLGKPDSEALSEIESRLQSKMQSIISETLETLFSGEGGLLKVSDIDEYNKRIGNDIHFATGTLTSTKED